MFLLRKSLQKETALLKVDFTQPWWQLIVDQKWLVARILLFRTPTHIFLYIAPFVVERLFKSPTVSFCATIFATWLFIECIATYSVQLNTKFQLQCIHSIYKSAHQYLLTIDPHYHTHRSSGTLLGKIERGARGYEELLDQIMFEFLPLLIGILVMIIALSNYSLPLACAITVLFIAMIFYGYYCARYTCQRWEKSFIATDDQFRATAVENLAQVYFVRSTFASDYISNKLTEQIKTNMRSERNLWLSYITGTFLLNMMYLGSLFLLISVLAWQINHGTTLPSSALALVIAYIQSTRLLVFITKAFRRYMRGFAAVKDLFGFIPTAGKQTYPVLEELPAAIPSSTTIAIKADNFSFSYETAKLFNNHTFSLECPSDQTNKLYGIIGASGHGKTTLISILGGQLKPHTGTVTINGIDIYNVNDTTRRQLIAQQKQIATSVRGTVKYNLLFGLPAEHGYSDQDLCDVLQRVGLLSVLSSQEKLDTMLGEGGLNISGGQRQRLNFAGLYLRACYYKPVLILIDEPTSSLDELSEAAITEMIIELAHSSVTLVIAHRLKTIESAVGFIDLSLLAKSQNITAYTPQELLLRSDYYSQLLQGKIDIAL